MSKKLSSEDQWLEGLLGRLEGKSDLPPAKIAFSKFVEATNDPAVVELMEQVKAEDERLEQEDKIRV